MAIFNVRLLFFNLIIKTVLTLLPICVMQNNPVNQQEVTTGRILKRQLYKNTVEFVQLTNPTHPFPSFNIPSIGVP